MYAFLKGILAEKQPTHIVLDVGGVGYEVLIPLSTFDKLPVEGGSVQLLTHFHVREDLMQLYGFGSEDERDLFRMLLGISGIGPKVALGVLSGMRIQEFKAAIASEDNKMIACLPGIGKKTAARLVLELKEKMSDYIFTAKGPEKESAADTMVKDAVLALVSLGYNKSVAYSAIKEVRKNEEKADSVEELIRSALKYIK